MDLEAILEQMEKVAAEGADLSTLRDLRVLLRKPEFLRQLNETYQRLHNNQPEADAIIERLHKIADGFSDRITGYQSDRKLVDVAAVGGGSALATGGAVATVTIAFPPLALLIVGAGGYAAYRGLREHRKLSEKISVLSDVRDAFGRAIDNVRID